MGKVKRNAPCPCGSGKKYKKCCGSKVVDFPAEMAAKEAKQIQEDLMEYAFTVHRESISAFINQYDILSAMDRQTKDISVFNLGIWGIFFHPLAGNQTIFEDYLQKKADSITRPKTRELVESWKSMTPALLLLKEMDETVIQFEDVVTKKQFHVEMDVKKQELPPLGSLILGYPIHEAEKAEFFMQFTIFPAKKTDALISKVMKIADPALQKGKTPESFMKEDFQQVLFALLGEEEKQPAAEEESIEWANDLEKETALAIEKGMSGEEYPDKLIPAVIGLWKTFCEKKEPVIRKPEAFAAAVEYYVNSISLNGASLSQAKLAKKYGVSASTISSRYKEIESVLKSEADSFAAAITS
ncbi:helix-turn-helix domain-containing protein [Bacillus atrophaeus]|uniref:helix-turn-helix domain-containing protein n=1 Tax=Bacillus atrophaeus TaxID=1452 RepID=UPI00228195FC|nr:helix-turn-helix domain-containing protein [Bacillus atrophaeus]MCY8907416.1 SEC-C domain-containing protein [Bacillus atrophaeus]MEC0836391.1 helix-turn-helix domain-containing protein [Bacillus atrophaeus]MEC0846143.1 helix-turn-helix domain-containing protein [Bacillus atrophaeus]MEC0849682.1 helix-turn-helix domain-containing protein [Bacillus atrophaeus]MEC0865235.1 helix-turn-helix domain-containing protein [Bacillus atrophaeus]